MTKKQYFDWIDAAKGLGIILVVFAHTLVPQIREESLNASFIWIFIYNFHMPLFFFLSGYLFEKGLERYTDKGKFILGKLKYLMLPYLTFSIFAYVFIAIALKIGPLASVLKSGGYSATDFGDAFWQILTYNGHTDQHLWFVYALFIVFAINMLIPKIMKSNVTLVILALLYVSKSFMHYPAILNYTMDNFIFFSLARVMADKDFKINSIVTAIVFIVTNCIYSYFYITGMDGILKVLLYVIRLICAVSGILIVCEISKFIAGKKISKLLKTIGAYSYDIYLMHAPFLVSGLMGILLSYSTLPPFLCCAGVLVTGIALPYVLSKIVIRNVPLFSILILGKRYGNIFKSNKRDISCTK